MHSPVDIELSEPAVPTASCLYAKRVAMVTFSPYPSDPRPRRAVDALIDAGMSVDLICLAEVQAPRRETKDRLSITRVPITHHRRGGLSYAYQYSAFLSISAGILTARSVKRRYSVVYVHNMPDFLVFSAVVPRLMGAKVILDMHDPMPELMTTIFNIREDTLAVRALRVVEKWSMAYAHAVITVNTACKRIFAERSCPPEKIRVVMNSPDEEIFPFCSVSVQNSDRASAKRLVLLYHGSLVERNGLDLAVDAVSKIRRTIPRVELRICGRNTPFLEQVMGEVRSKGIQDSVRYLGQKSLEEIVQEIKACDVGIIPNHRNAFTAINTPTRIFEYLALGKPVIAPRMPGIQDYFSPESLLFFDAGDPDDLARTIEHAYHHPAQAKSIARQGQEVYLSHTWQREKQTLVKTVSDVLANGAAR
jgi:glycosyltransferase involved in cell wall biosynthesis